MNAQLAPAINRSLGLGASEAAAAIGLSKWKTPFRLWQEKVGEKERDDSDALHLEMGQVLEPMILRRFEKQSGLTVSDQQLRVVDPNWPQRWVTLDGIASDGGVVEAKSTGFANPDEWGDQLEDNSIPKEYLIQTQHSLGCTGRTHAWVPLVVLNRQFRIYRVRRDDELIELITEREREFMRLVEARIPPDPVDLEDLSLRWPSHIAGRRIIATEEIAGIAAAHKQTKSQIKELEAKKIEFEVRLKHFMGDAAELVDAGGMVLNTWRQNKASEVFDKDAFQIANPTLYAQFLKDKPGARPLLSK